MRVKLPARSRQQARNETTADHAIELSRRIRGALEKNFLKGRRLVRVKIRNIEGNNVEGFLQIDGSQGERLLVDFRATSTPQGRLTSLEVGGERVIVASSKGAAVSVRRTRGRADLPIA